MSYASDDRGVIFKEHSLIVTQVEKAIKELENIIEVDKSILSETDLLIFENQ